MFIDGPQIIVKLCTVSRIMVLFDHPVCMFLKCLNAFQWCVYAEQILRVGRNECARLELSQWDVFCGTKIHYRKFLRCPRLGRTMHQNSIAHSTPDSMEPLEAHNLHPILFQQLIHSQCLHFQFTASVFKECKTKNIKKGEKNVSIWRSANLEGAINNLILF